MMLESLLTSCKYLLPHTINFLFVQHNVIHTSHPVPSWVWWGFLALIVFLLIVDLKLVMRRPHKITTREAAVYSIVWVSLGLIFGGVVWIWMGPHQASQYLTAYVVEKSLSVDNVFLWAVLFTYFAVPSEHQHRVLFWGIFGALVMRAAFIFGGIALLESIHWVIYIFGGILLITAYRLFFNQEEDEEDLSGNPVIRYVRRFLPQTEHYHGEKFLVKINGRTLATPLLTVLVVVELSDVIFAVDSIPAVLGVTNDKFIVFSSNAFAILGLRALYFLLADLKDRFVFLSKGLAIILAFVGIKFMVSEFYKIPTYASLMFIAVVLTITIFISIRHTQEEEKVKTG